MACNLTPRQPRGEANLLTANQRIETRALGWYELYFMQSDVAGRINPVALLTAGVLAVGALACGYLLAVDIRSLSLATVGIGWLVLLPYHSPLAVYLSTLTFGTALIVPFFPGRPYVWELASLLGWTGLVITFAMRQHHRTLGVTIRENWLLFAALAGFCLVLVVTMLGRGVGFRVLGNAQMGGRFYFQQISCAIFPLVFAACRWDERLLPRLLLAQCLMTTTYLVSDFVFSFAGGPMFLLLQFFELPGDALNFEVAARQLGLRRFQSLGIVGQGLFFALLLSFNLREFVTLRRWYLPPLAAGALAMGLYSGHRWVLVMAGLTTIYALWSQRFFNVRNTCVTVLLAIVCLAGTYGFSRELPLTVQRAVSFLPGIRVDSQSYVDAASTLHTRALLRQVGWQMVPDYLWLGRGFGLMSAVDYSYQWDPTSITWHVNQGKFYNGPIGLLVNTGLSGTIFMALFLGAGTALALRIVRRLRRDGCTDSLARACSVVASLWLAHATAFVFVAGDVEHALKTFAFLAGVLLVCDRHLQHRATQAQPSR